MYPYMYMSFSAWISVHCVMNTQRIQQRNKMKIFRMENQFLWVAFLYIMWKLLFACRKFGFVTIFMSKIKNKKFDFHQNWRVWISVVNSIKNSNKCAHSYRFFPVTFACIFFIFFHSQSIIHRWKMIEKECILPCKLVGNSVWTVFPFL